jgi:hypothetical protein
MRVNKMCESNRVKEGSNDPLKDNKYTWYEKHKKNKCGLPGMNFYHFRGETFMETLHRYAERIFSLTLFNSSEFFYLFSR